MPKEAGYNSAHNFGVRCPLVVKIGTKMLTNSISQTFQPFKLLRSPLIKLPSKQKSQMSRIYIRKAQPNISMYAHAIAIVMHVWPFKLLRSAIIKLPSKQKMFQTTLI